MADHVHPHDSPLLKQPPPSNNSSKVELPLTPDDSPPPGTYVFLFPNEQILRFPPPENARRYTFSILFVLIIALGIAATVLYLVFRPKSPEYTISSIAIKNFNVTSPSPISPEFDVTLSAKNPNNKFGIYYLKGSSVTLLHSDVGLCNGELTAFYQPMNNVTVFQTPVKGSDIILGDALKKSLRGEQKKGKVSFKVNVKSPVRFKVGAIKTWKIIVKVECDITVDALTEKSKILSKDCKQSGRL